MNQNIYGDTLAHTREGYGVDIASQRADDLDQKAVDRIRTLARPHGLDLACGQGGQALRMAQAGADMIASDIVDYAELIATQAAKHQVSVTFVQEDMRNLPGRIEESRPFDVIVCQRAIHYLPFWTAADVVRSIHRLLRAGGRLYISASGLRSELGQDYGHADVPVIRRYTTLSRAMVDKHGIHGPVCLYDVDDMRMLLETAEFTVDEIFSSAFGNVKAVASVP